MSMDWLAATRQAVHAAPHLSARAQLYAQEFLETVSSRIPSPLRLLQLPLLTPYGALSISSGLEPISVSCPHAQLSCHNTSVVANTCCFNSPGGQLLQTQFWDTHPVTGPADSWTIHGLWPDHCNGAFDAYCDKDREYTNISSILSSGGGSELLSFMKIFWKDYQGDDPDLWRHEWSKHGTCISTLETKCYHNYQPQTEVIDYFNRTISLFNRLPTYKILAAAGVVPSIRRRWTYAELQEPLKAMHGATVTLRCRNGVFGEVWYHFDVRGSVQAGQFVAAEPDGAKSNCPASGIKYIPKVHPPPHAPPTTTTRTTSGLTHTSTATDKPPSQPTGSPFTGKGFLDVVTINKGGSDSKKHGCLISAGWWYVSGTCATFRAQEDVLLDVTATQIPTTDSSSEEPHLFTLTSSRGPCGFVDGTFECAKTLQYQTIFSTTDDGKLSYLDRTTFYAASAPGRFEKRRVYATKNLESHDLEVEVVWTSSAAGNAAVGDGEEGVWADGRSDTGSQDYDEWL